MKQLIGFFILIVAFLAFVPMGKAECPVGTSPVTMITPSGKTKTLCINDNAVQGIENAADNSSTTVVPSSCTKGCWTPDDVENLSREGELICTWFSSNQLECTNDTLAGEKLVFALYIGTDFATCYSIVTDLKENIPIDEGMDACIALLEPYTDSRLVGQDCPCLNDYERIINENKPGETLGCYDYPGERLQITVNSNDIFSFYPEQLTKQTCGINNTSLHDINDEEAASCIDFLEFFAFSNEITCQ